MQTVNIHAAKTHLSRLIDAAIEGEEIVIARSGRPVARMVPLQQEAAPGRRQLGVLGGKLKVPDDFDAPLSEEIFAGIRGRLMRLLLDTHLLIWALDEPERLNATTRAIVEDEGNEVLFSVASIWEIAIKSASGRTDFAFDPQEVLTAAIQTGFKELQIRSEAAVQIGKLAVISSRSFRSAVNRAGDD